MRFATWQSVSRKLRRIMRSGNVAIFLERHGGVRGGACLVIAKALLMRYQVGKIIMVVRECDNLAGHALYSPDGICYMDGKSYWKSAQGVLRTYRRLTGYKHLRLEDYRPEHAEPNTGYGGEIFDCLEAIDGLAKRFEIVPPPLNSTNGDSHTL